MKKIWEDKNRKPGIPFPTLSRELNPFSLTRKLLRFNYRDTNSTQPAVASGISFSAREQDNINGKKQNYNANYTDFIAIMKAIDCAIPSSRLGGYFVKANMFLKKALNW